MSIHLERLPSRWWHPCQLPAACWCQLWQAWRMPGGSLPSAWGKRLSCRVAFCPFVCKVQPDILPLCCGSAAMPASPACLCLDFSVHSVQQQTVPYLPVPLSVAAAGAASSCTCQRERGLALVGVQRPGNVSHCWTPVCMQHRHACGWSMVPDGKQRSLFLHGPTVAGQLQLVLECTPLPSLRARAGSRSMLSHDCLTGSDCLSVCRPLLSGNLSLSVTHTCALSVSCSHADAARLCAVSERLPDSGGSWGCASCGFIHTHTQSAFTSHTHHPSPTGLVWSSLCSFPARPHTAVADQSSHCMPGRSGGGVLSSQPLLHAPPCKTVSWNPAVSWPRLPAWPSRGWQRRSSGTRP